MSRKGIVLALLFAGTLVRAESLRYDPMFDESRIVGRFGDTPVSLYLAPSPYISQALVEFITAATGTLDVCVYELNLTLVMDALLEAHVRGVKVRIAVPPSASPGEYDEGLRNRFKKLQDNKLIHFTRNNSGLMHNKFMVADGKSVWMGSYNFTRNDTEWNDNNAIVISNEKLAENYLAEFEEMWAGRHGKKNSTPTPNPDIQIGDTLLHNYFGPEDNLETAIVGEIQKATNSIYVMAFALSNTGMFTALTNKVAAGVRVVALFDLELARQRSSLIKPLKAAGVFVRISANNGQMHHKVIVIDENVVITGSANFSASAFDVNDENFIIFNSPPLARAFVRECQRCWQARPYIYSKWTQPKSY